MKSLSLSLIVLLLITSGCAGGEGDPAAVPQEQTQATSPTKTPGTTTPPGTTPSTSPGTTPTTPPVEEVPPAPPAPKLLTWKLSGTVRDGGTYTGTFKYDPKAPPRAQNINNLSPNVDFAFTDWKITLSETENHPEIVFTPENSKQTFCVGSCIFSVSAASEKIVWTDGVNTFYVVMPLPLTFTTLGVPLTQADWGPIDLFASGLEKRFGTGRFEFTLILLASGTVTQVQEEQ